MTRLFVFLLAVAVLASPWAAGVASADPYPHARTGFFIGFGLGWGNAGASLASGVDVDRENSGSGNFRLGWAANQSVTLGLESSSWLKTYDLGGTQSTDLKLTTTVTTFAVTVFPQNVGVYLRGGIGVAAASAEVSSGAASVEDTEYGLGLLAAVGYEWRLTGKFALGPQLQWTLLNIDDAITESIDFFSATAQATWYW
jgi:hypothetical protein